ncbi:MAG: hypothetical protein GY909_05750 [Oligoflexia bacterium]|nr:hypothetical protein [Oligoflexia bacterium]
MLSRHEQEKPGIPLPKEWSDKVEELLFNLYQKECDDMGRSFQAHGFTYPNELWIAIGLIDGNNLDQSPITYKASADIVDKTKPEVVLNTLVDSVGVFFDNFFSNPAGLEYIATWEEAEIKNQKIFYTVSRENIELTIQADYLLNQ